MNAADLAIIAAVLLSVLIGLWRGLVVEVMSLVVWVAAVIAARLFGEAVGELFSRVIEVPSARVFVGYGLVFLVSMLVGAIIIWLLRKAVETTGLTGTDRMFGMLFGLVRGVVVVSLAVLMAGFTPLPRDTWWQESRGVALILPLSLQLAGWLPESVTGKLDFHPGDKPAPAPTSPPSPSTQPAHQAQQG